MAKGLRKGSQSPAVTREDVDRLEQKYPELKSLNAATLDKERSFLITKEECVRICGSEKGFNRIRTKWILCVLWLRGITVEYEHVSKGYRFLSVAYHLGDRHRKKLQKYEKTHRDEAQRLGVMRDDDLNDHQRRLRVAAMESHANIAGNLNAALVRHETARVLPDTMPRPRVAGA